MSEIIVTDMKNVNRVELHAHTRYSNIRLVDALPTPEQLIDRAIELGLKGIAITDHDCLSGHIKANKYAQEILKEHPDFKVILGNEIYLVDERPNTDHYHFILLAKDKIGHKQLRVLSSVAWLNSYMSKGLERVDTLKEELEKVVKHNPGHLIASTACLGGELAKQVIALTKAEKVGDTESAKKSHNAIVNFILWCKELFGEDFYIEAQPGTSKDQIDVNMRLLSIAKCFQVKMIVTCDVHYLKKEDRYLHKSFLNAKEGEREVDAFYADTYLHTNEELAEKLYKSHYDVLFTEELLNNTIEIYSKIENYSLLHSQQIPSVNVIDYPKIDKDIEYTELKRMFNSDNKIERYWVNQCWDALNNKFDTVDDVYYKELEEEAEVKKIVGDRLGTNMFSYPVVLQHYIDIIWNCGSFIGAGRGSACSALNHWLLGITQLNPIEWKFPFYRYMNRDTDGLGDIDIDIAPSKRNLIIRKIKQERSSNMYNWLSSKIQEELGATYVCTFGTESTKSAVLTACKGYRSEDFPDGLDNDFAQYLSSLIPAERGFVWPLKDVYYGNPEKDRKPIAPFINEVDAYPGLFDIMMGIENIISRRGIHASGVIFFDEDPFEYSCFMKAPNGEIITQYDLHDAEAAGNTKFDFLVTEVQDKLVKTIELLRDAGKIEDLPLKDLYNKYLHPDILPLDDKDTWHTIQEAASLDLFQLDSEIGRQGAKKVKPTTMIELSSVNGLIRLMGEKDKERPMEKYVRFRNNPQEWENEMNSYHLTKENKIAIRPYLDETYGIGISQEQLMRVLMDKDICNFTLKEANKARKIVSKKKMNEISFMHELIWQKCKSEAFAQYVWDAVVAPQLGYSFSDIHSISYSFIGFQTAYIATHWNPIYWDTACLIVNGGTLEEDEGELVDIYEKEDFENYIYEDLPDKGGKIKKKATDYGKLASAISVIRNKNIKVSLVDINRSEFSFSPDEENNQILFGLKGLNKVGDEVVAKIITNRPYYNIKDFMLKCPITKTAMISLIKAGAFDNISNWAKGMEPRKANMAYFLYTTCGLKTRLTLQNYNGLIQSDLIPSQLDLEKRVFNFNKYLKTRKIGQYYTFDVPCSTFYNKHFDQDLLEVINGITCIKVTAWTKIYNSIMDKVRDWLKNNQQELLFRYNTSLFKTEYEKYAKGTNADWEMDSMCFYYSEHPLMQVDRTKYGLVNFNDLSPISDVEYYFKSKGRDIPIFKLSRIIGTVINKNDTRATIDLLTPDGVVKVKFSKEYYAMYKRQISEVNEEGKKTVKEKGWFSRGTKIMCTGYRREDTFVCKTYKNTPTHQLYLIVSLNDNNKDMELEHERYQGLAKEEI